MTDELAQAVAIVENRLYFVPLRTANGLRSSHTAAANICYCIDDELLFEPFFADFGPLNLGKAFRYCRKTQELLQEAERAKKRLYYCCGPHAHAKANAAVLVGIYQVLYLNRTAEDAFRPLQAFKPYVPFRDASCGVSTFHLTVLDCLKGIQKARDVGFIDWNSGNSTWSLEEYEQYEQVENGDLNWIVPGKLLAFSGPASRSNEIVGYRLFTPEDYWDYFKKRTVTAVVRLNKKVYDRRRFTEGGIRHYELYFPDGSCPSEAIILKFLEIAEAEPGALAIHCKAGLGRTGVLICCYMMKHFRFTAEECIGYIRIARPGSVIGPQQNFLCDVEARMWQEGDMYRQKRGGTAGSAGLGAQDLVVSGRPVASANGPTNGVSDAGPSYRPMGQMVQGGAYGLRSHISAPMPSNSADTPLMQYKAKIMASVAGASRMGSAGNGYGYGSAASRSSQGVHSAGGAGDSAADVTRSTSSIPTRAPSTDRAFERVGAGGSSGGVGSSLRSTLHTDTLRAADRPRALVERNLQSADVGRTGWRGGASAGGSPSSSPSSPSAASGRTPGSAGIAGVGLHGHRPAVVRTLAPNGQPRKVPMSMLPAYHAGLSGGLAGRSSAPNLQAVAAAEAREAASLKLRYGVVHK